MLLFLKLIKIIKSYQRIIDGPILTGLKLLGLNFGLTLLLIELLIIIGVKGEDIIHNIFDFLFMERFIF